MAGISSLGIGSGLDLNGLVSKLVAAERDPAAARLARQEAGFTAEISAFGSLRSGLSDFQGALAALNSNDSFQKKTATSFDTSILTASASTSAQVQSASIEVTQLAQQHALATAAFTDGNAVIGTGTLTLRFGTTSYDPNTDIYSGFTLNPDQPSQVISIDSSNNTVDGLRDYINQNNFGVKATVVNDGSGSRLVLTSSKSGAANSVEITVADSDGNNTDTAGLSALAFNSAATNLSQTQAAQDANLKVNGLAVTRDSNTVTGVLGGVTLSLKKAAVGTPVQVEVKRNTSAIQQDIENFVDKFNGLQSTINDISGYNADTRQGGVLLGDSAVRAISGRLRGIITAEQPGNSNSIRSLVDIGITSQADGSLSIDSSKLSTALSNDPGAVTALFVPQGRPTDSDIQFSAATGDTQPGTYAVSIATLATQGLYNGGAVLPADFVATPLVVDASNDTFAIKIDGVTSNTISITQGSYTSGTTLASVIQTQINADTALVAAGLTASVSYDAANNRFTIASSRYGSASTVEISSVDTGSAATLGLSIATGTPGVDVVGSINGLSATGSGRLLTSTGGASQGLALTVQGTTTGSRGSVEFSSGLSSRLDSVISEFLASDGLIQARENGLSASLQDISDSRVRLDERITALQDRLVRQFSALDALVAQLQQTSSFLTTQLASIPTANSGQ